MSKFDLLRCPVCRADLALQDRTLRCPQRHSFDLARSGYVNLLTGHGAAPAEGGDDPQQLARRDTFLSKGYFDAVADTIRADLPRHARSVLDAGCGTAYHLQRLVKGHDTLTATGLDISKDAAAFSAKRHPNFTFVVADIWRDWPVRDGCVDVLLSIFAPKNFPEAARVLRPGGMLAVAFPGPDHLIELRRTFGLLDQAEDKAETYAADIAAAIATPRRHRLRTDVQLPEEDVVRVILMGPNAKRAAALGPLGGARKVSFDIELLIAHKPL